MLAVLDSLAASPAGLELLQWAETAPQPQVHCCDGRRSGLQRLHHAEWVGQRMSHSRHSSSKSSLLFTAEITEASTLRSVCVQQRRSISPNRVVLLADCSVCL